MLSAFQIRSRSAAKRGPSNAKFGLLGAVIAAPALALAGCAGDAETDGVITEENVENDAAEIGEPVPAQAPGIGTNTGFEGPKSADTDQPKLGAGAVPDGALASDAEPGKEITGDHNLDANDATY